MVTVPAVTWRGGFVRRALTVGGVVGAGLGLLAWLDSGFAIAGAIVLVAVGTVYGTWMARRMARLWPGARELSGDERVAVARAVRSGQGVDDRRLAQPVLDYVAGLRSVATGRPGRWVLVFALVVGAAVAVWDAVYGSWGNGIASAIYLAAIAVELFWLPRWERQLLARADRAERLAQQTLHES